MALPTRTFSCWQLLGSAAALLFLNGCTQADGRGDAASAPSAGPDPAGATANAALGKAELGKPAPAFRLTSLDGEQVDLASYKGKTVVLEWFNPGCPFVKRNHGEGPLKDMAAKQAERGVVWLAINSGSAGKQGHGADVNKGARDAWAMKHPVLLDESGAVGKAYGAQHTPEMYIVDPAGVLVYHGAIDNAPDGDPSEGDTVINYVDAALQDVAAGRPVAKAETTAYGCSVKY
ncbi:MAG: redoxin family protein [Polyangiaceae bacterium]